MPLSLMRLGSAFALTTLSGVLYALAFPLVGWWPLAWVALVPFLVAVGAGDARHALGLGAWLGIVASYGVGTWMPDAVVNYYQQSIAVGVLMFLACALWQASWQYAGFAVLYRRLVGCGGAWGPLLVAAAWVSAEMARVIVPFGNPWALLGYSQTPVPLLVQTADLAGVHGISFVVAAANAALAGWWMARRRSAAARRAARAGLGVVTIVAAATVVYGARALRDDAADHAPALPVAAAQANLDLGTQWKSEFYGANLRVYADLTLAAVASRPARLVIWPESALTFFLESEAVYRAYLAQLLARAGTTLLTGGPRLLSHDGGEEYRNAAFLVSPAGEVQAVYDKGMLVPFAEYFPFSGSDLLRRQFGKVREFTPGGEQAPFATPIGTAGMMICNEAMLGSEAIDRVRRGAEWLVTLTNDSWVGRRQYADIALAMVRLRAVEVRRWLVRSSTSGPSVMIDPAGRIVDRVAFGTAGVARADVVPRRGLTIYARIGDAFAWGCVIVSVAAALRLWRSARTSRRPQDSPSAAPLVGC